MFTGVAVLFTFLFHLSFFTGCIAVSGYCERQNRHSVLCCKIKPLSKAGERRDHIDLFTSKWVFFRFHPRSPLPVVAQTVPPAQCASFLLPHWNNANRWKFQHRFQVNRLSRAFYLWHCASAFQLARKVLCLPLVFIYITTGKNGCQVWKIAIFRISRELNFIHEPNYIDSELIVNNWAKSSIYKPVVIQLFSEYCLL